MNILLLAALPPYPLHDGYNLHNFHHARWLARRHSLWLVTQGSMEDTAALDGMFRAVECVAKQRLPVERGGWHRILRSWSVDDVFEYEPGVASAIERVLSQGIDIVWISGIRMLPYAVALGDVPLIADVADDPVSALRAAESRGVTLRDRVRRLRDAVRMKRFESEFLRRADLCTVVAPADADALRRRNPELEVRIVPNGVDGDYFSPAAIPERPMSMVFEGNMSFRPNVDAAVRLVRELLPAIQRHEPRATVTIVGSDPAAAVRSLESGSVEVTGSVDDVRPYLARAELFVSPLLAGSGIKNKILQAWAMAKCVVASPVSCQGLPAKPGENIVVADTTDQFTRAVVDLLRDPARRSRIGRCGRRTAVEECAWPERSAELEAALERAIELNRRRFNFPPPA